MCIGMLIIIIPCNTIDYDPYLVYFAAPHITNQSEMI